MPQVELVEHLGLTFEIDREIMSDVIVKALAEKRYENREAQQLARLIQPGERVLELGGGLGLISALAARHPNTQAVRVFEANPALKPYIEGFHNRNGITGVEVVTGVLTNGMAPPTLPFYVRENFWASSLDLKPPAYKYRVDVPTRSFSAEIEAFKPTLIVCDIEGGEVELFANANLAGVRKVLLEIHQGVVGRRGIKKLFESFAARDFHYDHAFSNGAIVMFSHVDRDRMQAASMPVTVAA